MTVPNGYVEATAYLQVAPEFSHWRRDADGEPEVDGAKVTRVTQAKPSKPLANTVLVKLAIRLPVAAFRPLRPEAVVVVPESLTEAAPVVVEAVDPADLPDGGETP